MTVSTSNYSRYSIKSPSVTWKFCQISVQKSVETVYKEMSNTQVQHRKNQSKVANNMQGREEYQLNISNTSAALESLDGSGGNQWGLRKYQNIKISTKKKV